MSKRAWRNICDPTLPGLHYPRSRSEEIFIHWKATTFMHERFIYFLIYNVFGHATNGLPRFVFTRPPSAVHPPAYVFDQLFVILLEGSGGSFDNMRMPVEELHLANSRAIMDTGVPLRLRPLLGARSRILDYCPDHNDIRNRRVRSGRPAGL